MRANAQAVMPVRLFPRPACRVRAVSAAIGRFDRTPHRTGAVEPATAAAPAAPDGAAPAERRTGQKHKASSSPDVCLKLLARARYCALHACADAHSRATDCTAGPPAAAAAASAASAAPIEPSTSAARLSVPEQYDGDAAVDCVDIEQEHVVWLLRRNGPKAATAS